MEECEHCGTRENEPANLGEHKGSRHWLSSYECDPCGLVARARRVRKAHEKGVHEEK